MASPSATRTGIRHLPALDGLRGLALLGVLFFHAQGALPGGYLGVDLFFVLSGYLITSLLVAEHGETGRIALGSFWGRRARRLLPALLSLMPAIALYGRFFARPDEVAGLRADAIATLTYVANWRAIFSHKSYWELFATPSPLEHMWSLSIEEQFYVVWPLVVVLLLRRGLSRSLLALALALTAASMVAMVALFDPMNVSRVYLGTDTRAGGILAGAALAMLLPPTTTFSTRTVRTLDVFGVVAAVGLGVAWFKLDGQNPWLYRGGFWLTEIAVLVLVACSVAGARSIVARVLSFRPLTLVGAISYGLYLWHWPVNVFVTSERFHVHGLWLHAVQFSLTFAIAIVSYRFLEQPIRTRSISLGFASGRPGIMVPSAIAVAILLVVGATEARPEASRTHRAGAGALDPGRTPEGAVASAAITSASHGGLPASFRIMLVGDSTANSLGWALRGVQKPGLAVELRGQDGCTLLADMCGAPSWDKYTTDVRPNATVVALGGAFLHGIHIDGEWSKACSRGWDDKFRSKLEERLATLRSADVPGEPPTRIWLMTVPYALGVWDKAAVRAEVDCINTSIRQAAAAVPGVEILDLAERLCPKGVCEREADGVTIRPDGVHFSVDGAASISRWMLEQLLR